MTITKFTQLKTSWFPIALTVAIISGAITGYCLGPAAMRLQPLGDLFLHLIFVAMVPLVFFSVAQSIAQLGASQQLGKMLYHLFTTYLWTGCVAALFMLLIVMCFPPVTTLGAMMAPTTSNDTTAITTHFSELITVNDFNQLLTHQHMLPLIIFSILTGLATAMSGANGAPFAALLRAGNAVMLELMTLIMYLAPIGFFAYFAVLSGKLGAQLVATYLRVTVIYYVAGLVYFIFAYSAFAYLANRMHGLKQFWQCSAVPALTALATCSSAASIPASLNAAKKMGVAAPIAETVIPLGTMIHKDGSILGAIVKIAFLFALFGLPFTDPLTLLMAMGIALLVGTVMGSFPSGGMLGEMLIVSCYGFPSPTLMMIAAIGLIIDPLSTVLNVIGNTACSLLVARSMGTPTVTPAPAVINRS